MKKFCVLFLLVCTLPAGAELISEVTYNPSRLGKYRVLKVAEEATLPGGLQIPANGSMTVASNASVAMSYQPTGTTAPATPSFVVRSVETAESTPQRPLEIASKVSVNMPSATFAGAQPNYQIPGVNGVNDWSVDSNTIPINTIANVGMYGGEVEASGADSSITVLGDANGQEIYLTGHNMVVDNDLIIMGSSDRVDYYKPNNLYNTSYLLMENGLKGFQVKGVRINPWGATSGTNCRLAWVGRYALANATEPNSSGPVKKCVLARICGSGTPTPCQ